MTASWVLVAVPGLGEPECMRRGPAPSVGARLTPGCSTEPDALEDVERRTWRGRVRTVNYHQLPDAESCGGGRRKEQNDCFVRPLDRGRGRQGGVPVGTGADGVARGRRRVGGRRPVGRVGRRFRLVRAVGAPGRTAGNVLRIRRSRRCGHGGRGLVTGEQAAPALRQRQEQAACQDQGSNDTTSHTFHPTLGRGGWTMRLRGSGGCLTTSWIHCRPTPAGPPA